MYRRISRLSNPECRPKALDLSSQAANAREHRIESVSLHPPAGPKAPGQVSLSASDVSDLVKSSVCSGSEGNNMRSVKPESGWNARGNWDNSGAIYGGCTLIP